MICPDCGADSITTANYCRLCGRRLKAVSEPIAPKPLDLTRAFKKLFIGIALLIIAFVPLLEGEPMMWWLLFPGVPMIVKGMRLLVQANTARCLGHLTPAPTGQSTTTLPGRISLDIRVRPTGELVPPPSVTESTTRLLEEDKAVVRRAGV